MEIEQIVADALENMGATEQPKTKVKRATKVNNCVDGAAIGDIIAQVIATIQPVFVKSITVAVTTAVEAATEQIMANVRREMGVIEDVGKKLCSLQVENQKLTFEIDRLEQYSRRENVRIYGLAETQGECTNTVVIDMARDIGVTITPADISVSHRLGRPEGGGSTADSRPRPLIVKLVRRDTKFELMLNKKMGWTEANIAGLGLYTDV